MKTFPILLLTLCLHTLAAAAPVVTTHPDDVVSHAGGGAAFSVVATDPAPLTYQWRFNGEPIPGNPGAELVLSNLSSSQAGGYSVAVSNGSETTVSRAAHLCVTPTAGGPVTYDFSPRYPIPNGMTFLASHNDGSRYYCVGKNGALISSADAISWEACDSTVGVDLNGIAKGTGTLVAVGEEGCVITSTDGTDWWQRSSGTHESLRSITFGAGKFVAVGTAGTILTSANGISWTANSGTDLVDWNGVAFGASQFVAVGAGGAVKSSPDGTTWVKRTSGVSSDLKGIYHGGSKFVAMGKQGKILVSTDAVAWAIRTVSTGGKNSFPRALLGGGYGDSTHIVVGENGSMWVSVNDAQSWLVVGGFSNTGPDNLHSVVHGSGGFVAMGYYALYSSSDAIVWTLRGDDVEGQLSSNLAEMNGSLVAMFNVDGTFGKSIDGLHWSSQPIISPGSSFQPYTMCAGNGKLVAFNGRDGLFSSDDGTHWTLVRSGEPFSDTFDGLYTSLFAGGKFVFSGYRSITVGNFSHTFQDLIESSSNGSDWGFGGNVGQITSSSTTWIDALAYGNGIHLAVGKTGRIYTSPDAVNWTRRLSGVTSDLYGAVYCNGKFFVVGKSNKVLSSTNGVSWASTKAPWSKTIDAANSGRAVIAAVKGSLFVASAQGRYRSANGKSWTRFDEVNNNESGYKSIGNRVYGVGGYVLSQGIARPLVAGPDIGVSDSSGTELPHATGTVDLGKVAVGNHQTSTLTISNSGGTSLRNLKVSLSGGKEGDFRVTGPVVRTVLGGGTTTFTVSFVPTGKGTSTTKLTILSNDSDHSPFTLQLTGTGLPPVPEIGVIPSRGGELVSGKSKRNLGKVRIGKSGPPITFTITNTGVGTLSKLRIRMTGSGSKSFVVSELKKSFLQTDASTPIKVKFKPVSTGKQKATLLIYSNDPDESPFEIKLSGKGIPR